MFKFLSQTKPMKSTLKYYKPLSIVTIFRSIGLRKLLTIYFAIYFTKKEKNPPSPYSPLGNRADQTKCHFNK